MEKPFFFLDPEYWDCFGLRAKEVLVEKPKAAIKAVKAAYDTGANTISFLEKVEKYLPFALGAAVIGGAVMMAKGEAKSEHHSTHTPTPDVFQPQTQMPLGNVAATYPAAVGTVQRQQAYAIPQPARWAQRVGGTTPPPTSYAEAEQTRAEQATTAQLS